MKEEQCIGENCFCWVTYFYYKDKKLKKPIIRCIANKCYLDGGKPSKVNEHLKNRYPIEY